MITQPDYQLSSLKTRVEEAFDLEIRSLNDVPWGETTWAYAVECKDKSLFFLKVYPGENVAEESLRLVERLYSDCHLENIVHPIKAKDGKVRVVFGAHTLVLFNYIEGVNARECRLTISHTMVLGRILAKLHNSTSKVADYPVKERFELPFLKPYLKMLETIEHKSKKDGEPQKEMKNLMLPLLPRLQREASTLQSSRAKALTIKPKFVICHGNLTQGNILLSPAGDLYLADWDSPILAPKERDLAFLSGPKLMFVMKGYKSILPNQDVDDALIEYYQHRRYVDEISILTERILAQQQDEEQSWIDLDELVILLTEMQVWKRKETTTKKR